LRDPRKPFFRHIDVDNTPVAVTPQEIARRAGCVVRTTWNGTHIFTLGAKETR
jgi:hypothetical protein